MTNQEAIKELSEWLDACCGGEEIEPTREAFRMAIEALKAQDVPDTNVGDMIYRQAAIDIFDDYNISVENGELEAYSRDRKRLCDLPSAQPEQSSEIRDILDYLDTELHPIVSPENWNVYAELHDMISTLPSTQPEIIRCRDCKHWDKTWTNDWDHYYHYCPMIDGVRKGDFYCADAERRTDDEE